MIPSAMLLRWLIIAVVALAALFRSYAANPSFTDFNTNQFTNTGTPSIGQKLHIKPGALITNPVETGGTYTGGTFSGNGAGLTNLSVVGTNGGTVISVSLTNSGPGLVFSNGVTVSGVITGALNSALQILSSNNGAGLTNLAITNYLAAGTNITFRTNSGVVTVNVSSNSGGSTYQAGATNTGAILFLPFTNSLFEADMGTFQIDSVVAGKLDLTSQGELFGYDFGEGSFIGVGNTVSNITTGEWATITNLDSAYIASLSSNIFRTNGHDASINGWKVRTPSVELASARFGTYGTAYGASTSAVAIVTGPFESSYTGWVFDGTNLSSTVPYFSAQNGATLGKTNYYIESINPTLAPTNILYVNPRGVTVGKRGSPFLPWNNISNALVAARSGDTILISGSNNITPIGYFIASQMNAAILLRMKSNITIRGLGNDAEIHGDGVGNFMVLEDTSNITIENIAFTGNYAVQDTVNLFLAIGLCGTNANTRVLNCRFSNLGDHGIGVARHNGNGLKNHSGALISGNLFENVGGSGALDGAAIQPGRDGWVIVDNVITNCLRGVEFEGDFMNLSTNHVVSGNLIHTREQGVMILDSADTTNQYRNIKITGNTFTGSISNTAINAGGLTDGVISGNSFQGGQFHINIGSSLAGSTNNLIENNTFLPTFTSGSHITIQADTGNLIIGTVVRNNLFRSSAAVTTKYVAVDGPNAINTLIAGNSFYWVNDYVVRVGGYAATNTIVTGNFMPDSGIYGNMPMVKVEAGAKDTLIYGNINLTNAAGTVLGGVSNLSTTTRILGQYTGTNAFALASNLWATGTNILVTNLQSAAWTSSGNFLAHDGSGKVYSTNAPSGNGIATNGGTGINNALTNLSVDGKYILITNRSAYFGANFNSATPTDSTGVGVFAMSSNSGSYSSGFGANALSNNSGSSVSGFGSGALYRNTGPSASGFGANAGSENIGTNITAIGVNALKNNSGYGATAVGFGALDYNTADFATAIGIGAMTLQSGAYATALGAGAAPVNIYSNVSVIGFGAEAVDHNQIALGNSYVTSIKVGTGSQIVAYYSWMFSNLTATASLSASNLFTGQGIVSNPPTTLSNVARLMEVTNTGSYAGTAATNAYSALAGNITNKFVLSTGGFAMNLTVSNGLAQPTIYVATNLTQFVDVSLGDNFFLTNSASPGRIILTNTLAAGLPDGRVINIKVYGGLAGNTYAIYGPATNRLLWGGSSTNHPAVSTNLDQWSFITGPGTNYVLGSGITNFPRVIP